MFRDGKEQPGPNFAGNVIVVQWGFGAPCTMMALVDANTGVVYLPPLFVDNTFAEPLLTIGPESLGQNPVVEFRRDSRLMLVSATPHGTKQGTEVISTTSFGAQITGPSFIGSRWIEQMDLNAHLRSSCVESVNRFQTLLVHGDGARSSRRSSVQLFSGLALLLVAALAWLSFAGYGIAYGDLFGVPGAEAALDGVSAHARIALAVALSAESFAVIVLAWLLFASHRPTWIKAIACLFIALALDYLTFLIMCP